MSRSVFAVQYVPNTDPPDGKHLVSPPAPTISDCSQECLEILNALLFRADNFVLSIATFGQYLCVL